jgi:hypothetical protein
MNNRVVTTEEKGGLSSVSCTYPVSLVGILRAAFSASRTYDFQIHNSTAQGTSGAGAILSYMPWSPALITYVEWSALAALFDEVKLLASHMTWTGIALSSTIPCQISLAPDYATNGSTPSSFTTVMRLAESAEFSSHLGSSSGGSTTIIRVAKPPRGRPYAPTSAPAGTGPITGCCGQWSFANSTASTASVSIANVVLRNIVRLRMRA